MAYQSSSWSKGWKESTSWKPEAWSLSRVLGRPDSELDDHHVSAHEAKVSVAQQQQEVVRATHSEAI